MKYKLTEKTQRYLGKDLYRIQALKDFGDVKAGDIGGWVESETNLSQEGECWIYNEAKVYGDAQVLGNALVSENARIYGNARISDEAYVYGNADICGNAEVCEKADVYDNAHVFGNARVMGQTQLYGRAEISGNALIKSSKDYCVFQSFGSRNDITSFFRDSNGDIFVNCGCFYGNLKEFKSKVKDYHGDNKFGKEYSAIIEVVKIKFEELSNELQSGEHDSAFNHIKRKVAFFNKMFKFKK